MSYGKVYELILGFISLDLGGMERGLWCVGSNVESVKRRRVVKRRRKHIEIVDWALERRALLEL